MPKVKKDKSSSDNSDSDSGPEDRNPPPKKKSKDTDSGGDATGTGGSQANAPNQWTLEKLRQVRINEFRGRKMVDIREYYEKNGEYLPGKKGISLTLTQWKKLLEIAPEVDKALSE